MHVGEPVDDAPVEAPKQPHLGLGDAWVFQDRSDEELVELAEEMATLDWLTDGRMMLGVGLGYIDREYDSMQAPKSVRVGRFTEAIAVMRKLWTGERVSHDGRHFPLDDVQVGITPKQPGGPPILIGAGVDAAVRRAARIGDGWLITFATERPPVFLA